MIEIKFDKYEIEYSDYKYTKLYVSFTPLDLV